MLFRHLYKMFVVALPTSEEFAKYACYQKVTYFNLFVVEWLHSAGAFCTMYKPR